MYKHSLVLVFEIDVQRHLFVSDETVNCHVVYTVVPGTEGAIEPRRAATAGELSACLAELTCTPAAVYARLHGADMHACCRAGVLHVATRQTCCQQKY